jgi:membrane fusion protein, multidrug efflux system
MQRHGISDLPAATPSAMLATLRGLGVAAVVLLGWLLAGCSAPQANESDALPAPVVSVAPVIEREVARWDEFSGHVEAVETVELRPRVSGHIDRVAYEEGQEVAAGALLFVIDPRSYRAALARAEAELASARSQAAVARSEAERARRLAESRVLSAELYEQRAAAVAQAEAAVRAAEAARDIARLELGFTEVRAPIAGRAGRALVTAGNLVSTQPNATLLTTIVSLDPVHVVFRGDEQSTLRAAGPAADGRRNGNPVQVGLAGDENYPFEGVLDFVDNHVDPGTGTIAGRAMLANAERLLTPGQFARVRLYAHGSERARLIDERAVLTDQDRKYVWVLGEGDRALRRDIVLGRKVDGLRVVEQGLAAGEPVIVHGVQKVFFPGMPVQPQPIAMGDGPALAAMPHP